MANQTIRILLVDGSSVTRALLTKTLLEELPRVEVTAVGTCAEAIDKLSQIHFENLSSCNKSINRSLRSKFTLHLRLYMYWK